MTEEFRVIVADPPWHERGGGKYKRGADRHYPLMKTLDITNLLAEQINERFDVAADAHLYLWVTNTYLPDGLRVVEALGFRYVTNVAWVKPSIGIGQYFRGAHELCLFAVRGRGVDPRTITERRDLPGVLRADYRRDASGRRVHSGKPEEFYNLVEARSRGPYLELFGRRPREGWTVDHHGEAL